MNKLETLKTLCTELPEEFEGMKRLLLDLVEEGNISTLRAYCHGAFGAARRLTNDCTVLTPLQKIIEILG